MKNLSNIGQGIIQQSKLFDEFLEKLTIIEISEQIHSEELFNEAFLKIPMFTEKLKNLQANLNGIQTTGQKLDFLKDQKKRSEVKRVENRSAKRYQANPKFFNVKMISKTGRRISPRLMNISSSGAAVINVTEFRFQNHEKMTFTIEDKEQGYQAEVKSQVVYSYPENEYEKLGLVFLEEKIDDFLKLVGDPEVEQQEGAAKIYI